MKQQYREIKALIEAGDSNAAASKLEDIIQQSKSNGIQKLYVKDYCKLVLAAIEHQDLGVLTVLLSSLDLQTSIKQMHIKFSTSDQTEAKLPMGYVCLTKAVQSATDDLGVAIVELLLGMPTFSDHLNLRHLEQCKDKIVLLERLMAEPYFTKRPSLTLPYQWRLGMHDKVTQHLQHIDKIGIRGPYEVGLYSCVAQVRQPIEQSELKFIRNTKDKVLVLALVALAIEELMQRDEPQLMQVLLNSPVSFRAFSDLIYLIIKQAKIESQEPLNQNRQENELLIPELIHFSVEELTKRLFENIDFTCMRDYSMAHTIELLCNLAGKNAPQGNDDMLIRWLSHLNNIDLNAQIYDTFSTMIDNQYMRQLVLALNMPDRIYQAGVKYGFDKQDFELALHCLLKVGASIDMAYPEQLRGIDEKDHVSVLTVLSLTPSLRTFLPPSQQQESKSRCVLQ